MNGPTYQYTLALDDDNIVQFDWKLFYRERVELIYTGEEKPLPKEYIGKRAGDVRPPNSYFAKPK
jgi:putative transposon-encoded protein